MRDRNGHRGSHHFRAEGHRGPRGGGRHTDGHPGAGHHGGGRRRRRNTMFDQGELQVFLLSLIAEQPRHGYELIGAINTLSGEAYAPSPGMIYPALTFMEEAGLIAIVDETSSRKSFTVTPEGEARLLQEAENVAQYRNRLAALATVQERTDPAPVRRAMVNLKTTVLNRLGQHEVSQEQLFQIVDIIDEAARKIERMGL